MTVTMQNGSTLYAGFYAAGASITFDPASQNTIVLNGDENAISTSFYGVSENTHFAINGANGVVPSSAAWSQGADGTYTLVISTAAGKTITLGEIHTADGFVPGVVTIKQDSVGNYILDDANAAGTTPNYAVLETHQQLADLAASSSALGGDLSQYSTTVYANNNHSGVDYFTGTGTASNPAAWEDGSNWSSGEPPQSNSCQDANITGTAEAPVVVTASQANPEQFTSLSVMDNATLNITAQSTAPGYVFSTEGMEIRGSGQVVIDTPSRVELGGVDQIDGTLTIRNNDGNVVLDGSRLSGSDGTLNLDNSTLGSSAHPVSANLGQINLTNNSTLYAGFYASGTTVAFDTSQNTVIFTGYESAITTEFDNVSQNTHFGFNASSGVIPLSSTYSLNDDGSYTLVIDLNNGKSLALTNVHLAEGFTPGQTTFSQTRYGDWVVNYADTCFLTGTLIRTDRGDVAVEDLEIGDRVAVLNGEDEFSAITWAGSREKYVSALLSEADAGYPVRIRANAFEDGIPARDLLVTVEHCLFVNGGFIPARMLVNGTSIAYDLTTDHYRYHHIETAQHSIVFAENLPTESYLDTGNRSSFENTVTPLFASARSWDESAAPLMVEREQVEPVFARLVARAEALNMGCAEVTATTTNAELTLTTLENVTLRRLRENAGRVMFEIPAGVEAVRILSRTGRPSEIIGPFCDDRRDLGVLVGEVTLWDSRESRTVTTHLTTDAAGWHPVEQAATRWTAGNAILSLPRRELNSASVLSIQVVAAGPYLMKNADQEKACAA